MELVTRTFQQQAISFPSRVEQMLSEVTTLNGRKDMLDKAAAMQEYAKRLKAGIEIEKPIAIGVLKIKAGLGELMPREKGGRGKTSTTDGAGLDPKTVTAYRKLADNRDKLDDYCDATDDVPSQTDFIRWCGGGALANKFTGETEWYTPKEWIERARKAMGRIDCDPASSSFAQKVVKAKTYYTVDDNGLECEWYGNVWLNPPYKHPEVSHFVNELCDEFEAKRVKQAILLVNNVTDTKWFHRCMKLGYAAFTIGRIAFYNADGESSAPTNGQVFFYFGARKQQFCDAFSGYCTIMKIT